jgi:hypothetical protein
MPDRSESKPSDQKLDENQIYKSSKQWQTLSAQLPDVPDLSVEEIVAEVKQVRTQK